VVKKFCLKRTPHFKFAVQYSTVQYSTVQYSTVQYSTVQYQYSTVLVLQVFKYKIWNWIKLNLKTFSLIIKN